MADDVTLIGLDFGTTTSSAVVATASLTQSVVTGRKELSQVRERFRSEMVFTPLDDEDKLDEQQVERYLDSWLVQGNVRPDQIFGGGALLTGLTARKQNADRLVRLIRRRLGDALIATADDPCLESWLAFMGSCANLSRARPRQPVLNLDLGGGTTNLALGRNGKVLRTGCLFVGARHVEVVPGSYRIVRLSQYAQALFEYLGISSGPGDTLIEDHVQSILDFYLRLLEAAVAGSSEALQGPATESHAASRFRRNRPTLAEVLQSPIARLHVQVPFHRPPDLTDAAITFSGGVAELIYGHVQGRPWPATTHFGDLGIDLARRIVASPVFSPHLLNTVPESAGRATVYGLLRHSTEVSGSTLFLPRPEVLPLTDVPILGTLSIASSDDQIRDTVELVQRSDPGGCVLISLGTHDSSAVRGLGERIASVLRQAEFRAAHLLVLLVRENLGKVLGHYVTQWGALPLNLVVVDEVADRNAQYVRIGKPHNEVVPVSFYGMNE